MQRDRCLGEHGPTIGACTYFSSWKKHVSLLIRETMTSRCLSFVCNSDQAISVRDKWGSQSFRVVVCLDDGLFSTADAALLFGPGVTIVGRSEFGLSAAAIFEQAVKLAEDLHGASDGSWPARVDQWLLESHKRWLIYAVHSLQLIESAFNRFSPEQVWIPEHAGFSLTLSPDTDPSNPLFFDLLAAVCRRAGIRVNRLQTASKSRLPKTLIPFKYVSAEWIGLVRNRRALSSGRPSPRPVIIDNLDNDFHRHFDLGRLDRAAKRIFAWVRDSETMVPAEELLEHAGLPKNTRFAWLYKANVDWASIGHSSGVTIRRRAGLRFLLQSIRHKAREKARRNALKEKYRLPWLDILLEMDLPAIHEECRVAASYYCVFEYERARSIMLRWKPALYVTAADHWPYLPHVAAARDQGVATLSTESGLSFVRDNFAQKQADIVCVFGEEDASIVSRSYPQARVIIAGDALAPATREPMLQRSNSRRVLFVMSGRMFGWWFGSLIFDYPAYVKALVDFAEGIRGTSEPLHIVLKSHPVSDLHELYDKMVNQHSDVFEQHRKESMSEDEIAEYDVAVVFGAASAFTAELIRARVPVVYFTGALTEFGKSYHKYDGLEVAADVKSLIQKLMNLLGNQSAETRRSTLQRDEEFFNRYVDPRRRTFSAVLDEVLGPDGLGALQSATNVYEEPHEGICHPNSRESGSTISQRN